MISIPYWLLSSSSDSVFRSTAITCAPAWANPIAHALPIPLAAPVTKTFLPANDATPAPEFTLRTLP
ncbi:unannotated protein [freshwater metagenome]|uniref:Unannotated protein n=1 Tax=freshwater metagenome TaxID=449393 RepID=A0A6J7BKG2_9ZZZZ